MHMNAQQGRTPSRMSTSPATIALGATYTFVAKAGMRGPTDSTLRCLQYLSCH